MSVDAINGEALAALPLLPRDEQGPVFVEPWQAQVFGVVVQLNALERFLIEKNLTERELLEAERQMIREDGHHRRDAQLHHHPH